jgi:acyl-coenzyme A thioesterase PaaI-like protein
VAVDGGAGVRERIARIFMLRPGQGDRLQCRAQVLKAGRAFHVVEAEVFGTRGAERVLVARFNATMAVVRVPG